MTTFAGLRSRLSGRLHWDALALCCAATLAVGCEDGAGAPLGTGGGPATGSGGTDGGSGGVGGSAGAGNLAGEGGGGVAGASLCPADPACDEDVPGDSCSAPVIVSDSGFVVRGEAFTDDFRDDLALAHESCPITETGASEAVFQVELQAGEELWVTQTGRLAAAIAIQQACGAAGACRALGEERGAPVRYLANSRETVYVVVAAIQAEPRAEEYEIHIDIDPACNNGTFEGPEQCDDGNTLTQDGCAPDCSIEFPYYCDLESPSECKLYPSLGELGADSGLEPPFTYGESLEAEQELVYTLTFTERVVAVLEAHARGSGDIDITVRSSWSDVSWSSIESGDELSEALGFEPGIYLIRFNAGSPLPEGFEFDVTTESPPECGNELLEPPFEECDNGGETGCSEACYVDFGFECQGDAPSNCAPLETLGEFAGGDPIPDESYPVPMSAVSSHYHMIRFTEDVLLSATALGIEPEADAGNYVSGLRFTNESGAILVDQRVTPAPFTGLVEVVDQPLPADLYRIEVFTDTGLPKGYLLTLSTRTP